MSTQHRKIYSRQLFETLIADLKARQHGQQWLARCPAHDDRQASLSLTQSTDGTILLKCFAGCDTATIVGKVGLTMADLFPPKEPKREIVATYDYRDEHGKLLFQAVRFFPKGFSQRQPDGAGGWTFNIRGVRRVLYRLPNLLKTEPTQGVFLCEGEKDADRLWALGLAATTNPMGAGKWRPEYIIPLIGREVIILPDNDDPGRQHAHHVAAQLQGKAAVVKVLELPGLPAKGDVSDWLDAGGEAESLCVLSENAAPWTPPTAAEKMATAKAEKVDVLDLVQEQALLFHNKAFRAWLARLYFRATGAALTSDNEKEVLGAGLPPTANGDDADGWEAPAPFFDFALPDFPVDALPSWLRSFVDSLASATQTPLDLAALMSIAVCSAAVARNVRVKARAGWEEPLNVFIVIALPPANRKSQVVADATRPLLEYERELILSTRERIAEEKSEYSILLQELSELEKRSAKADLIDRNKLKEDAKAKARELAARKLPTTPKLIVDDVTAEVLATILAEQNGRVALFSAEGGIFETMAGRYTNGTPNIDVLLKGHSGDDLRVDRRDRSEHIEKPALTIALALQPEVLRGLIEKPGFRGRGLDWTLPLRAAAKHAGPP